MDREFSDFIATVLDKTDIVRLISRYARLERKGGTYWACCPFHSESQPSFAVNEAKQFFHCFGCKESGNAIHFLMKVENIEFIDALKLLAEQAGLEMPKTSSRSYGKVDRQAREQLFALMRTAARHYHDNLSDARAKVFRDYLEQRNIPQSMVIRFGLGASLDFTEMIDFLKSKGYTYEQMHAVGIAETKDSRQYDVFGKRLIYPIIDNMGQVVAFGGRTLEKDVHFAKYRNSSATEIFDKSKVIYGINLLKKRKAAKPIDYVIMTEGYMDVIALHKAGFDVAVASMGTALTTKQAKQLRIYSDRVYISYDGDNAGQKATMRGLDILRDCGLTVKVVRLPDGLDPDDLIKRDGAAGYQKLLDEAIPLTAYKIEVLKNRYNIQDPDQKAKFAIEAAAVVSALDNPVEEEQYFKYISDMTGFSVDALMRQANVAIERAGTEREHNAQSENAPQPVKYDETLKFFLSSVLQDFDYIDFDFDVTEAMPDARTKKLYELCRNIRSTARVIAEFDDEDAPFIEMLLDYTTAATGDRRKRFRDSEIALYRTALEKEMENYTELYNTTHNEEYAQRLRQLIAELAKYPKNRS